MWVDRVLIIDAWRDQAPTTYTASRTLTAGNHQVKVEYYEKAGGAVAKVSWASSDPAPGPTCTTGQYVARYYNNTTLTDPAVLSRCEAAINYSWGSGSPDPTVTVDSFSARWVGTHSFAGGQYTFTARSDDGIRVWVDDALIIDAWKRQAPTTYTAMRTLTAGDHVVKVEYFEYAGGAVAEVGWASG